MVTLGGKKIGSIVYERKREKCRGKDVNLCEWRLSFIQITMFYSTMKIDDIFAT